MKSWFEGLRKTECDNVREWLSPYLDDELDSAERQRVASHLESCQLCREEYASLRKAVSLIRHMPAIEPRRAFTITEIAEKTWNGKLKALGASTALAAIFLALIFIGDICHFFDTMALPSQPWTQPSKIGEYYWPVRETEFGLIGVFVILIVATFIHWRKRVRKSFRRR